MEHGQGPEINRFAGQTGFQAVAEAVEIGAAVMIHDPLGLAGSATGIVEGADRTFIIDSNVKRLGTAGHEQCFIVGPGQRTVIAGIADVDKGTHLRQFPKIRHDRTGKLVIDKADLGIRMIKDIGDLGGGEADIDCHQDGSEHRHGKMGLQHGGRVR